METVGLDIAIILFAVIVLAVLCMLVMNTVDFIRSRKILKEIQLKIREMKIKEIELN